ncbi:POZ domain-containing protein [Chaetoceros tenuissimus]|uniref:POZ domain-containing protein n=1 Tax=Chaetoceros tenuissimus TaxID=426638 RepID=A0AAD3D610_9STRA|nr:POZ domain-containing protein [Chaetoceros tenuissimus]
MAPSTSSTITFNVGGTIYKVSKTLLEKFPGSLLERCASKTWNEGGDEVFIEGDGTRFRQVLDYMRHSKVTLPRGESTASFLTELKYYGIEYDKDMIINSDYFYLPNIKKVADSITEANQQKKLEFLVSTIATDAMKKTGIHILGNNRGGEKSACTITYSTKNLTFASVEEGYIVYLLLHTFETNIVVKRVNDIIARAGLKVKYISGCGGVEGDYFFVDIEIL